MHSNFIKWSITVVLEIFIIYPSFGVDIISNAIDLEKKTLKIPLIFSKHFSFEKGFALIYNEKIDMYMYVESPSHSDALYKV